jgi:hypothetical protein
MKGKKNLRHLFVAILLLASPFYLLAWGPTGHRVIAEIARLRLNDTAFKAVKGILGNESMALAGTWADDFARYDPDYRHTSTWHYINPTPGLNYEQFLYEFKRDTTVNAFTMLNNVAAQLKTGAGTPEEKKFYLRMLIHLVGDAHQPMHVSREEDLGGNLIKVQWFDTPTNIHAVWDKSLIDQQQLSYTEYVAAINHPSAEQQIQWQGQSVADWFYESYKLSEKIYDGITQAGQRLDWRYNYEHIATVNEQLLKAGIRLAHLLNGIFENQK